MNRPPMSRERVLRLDPQGRIEVSETLAEETPIALVYNGRSHAVMMATPADLDDFAYGFTLSEGIVDDVSQIEIVDRLHTPQGVSLQMLIPRASADALDSRQRNLTGRTGCGLCGAGTLEAAIRPIRRVACERDISSDEIIAALAELTASQPLNDECGALHAAGFVMRSEALLVREDVGRHNAIDKLIGAAAIRGGKPRALLVTSRASYEVVHKAAQAQCPVVAAISAPTALAVRLASEAGITLLGFLRHNRMTIYTGSLRDTARVPQPLEQENP